jgi:pseudaminic acid biosynthesis-associated methylase
VSGFITPQEEFWAGDFGTEYISRNCGDGLLASNIAFFSRALRYARGVKSCLEFGANIGLNLRALQALYPRIDAHGIEINNRAAHELAEVIPASQIYNSSILTFSSDRQWDLTLIKTVLIHISPDHLPSVYEKLWSYASRYILIAEYYSRDPVEIAYRGHSDRLFKRDFAGELCESYPTLKIVDYGFAYHRDPSHPQDDITWFLIEKSR